MTLSDLYLSAAQICGIILLVWGLQIAAKLKKSGIKKKKAQLGVSILFLLIGVMTVTPLFLVFLALMLPYAVIRGIIPFDLFVVGIIIKLSVPVLLSSVLIENIIKYLIKKRNSRYNRCRQGNGTRG